MKLTEMAGFAGAVLAGTAFAFLILAPAYSSPELPSVASPELSSLIGFVASMTIFRRPCRLSRGQRR
jgi:hypothetical protein